MLDITQRTVGKSRDGALPSVQDTSLINVFALGAALSLFFAITYALCIIFYLFFPEVASGHAILLLLLPGFKLLTWTSFLLGLVETFAYGWFVALVFAPIYNFFVVRWH
jgi:hypothetical protein